MDYTVVTPEMFEAFLSGIKSQIGIVIPVAVGLLVIVSGVGYVLFVINRFRFNNLVSTKDMDDWSDSDWDFFEKHKSDGSWGSD